MGHLVWWLQENREIELIDYEGVPAVVRGKRWLLRLIAVAALVFLLPLAGASAAGKPLLTYLQFPPMTSTAPHPPFSLPVFLGLTLLIFRATVPIFRRMLSFRVEAGTREAPVRSRGGGGRG